MKSKQLALFLIGFVAIFAFTSQAFAREPVDPSTLNPPPRADTICERVGNGIICDVQFSDPPFAGGSGVICGTGANAYEVFQFLNRSVRGKRYYDQNGNLLRRHFREVLSGRTMRQYLFPDRTPICTIWQRREMSAAARTS